MLVFLKVLLIKQWWISCGNDKTAPVKRNLSKSKVLHSSKGIVSRACCLILIKHFSFKPMGQNFCGFCEYEILALLVCITLVVAR